MPAGRAARALAAVLAVAVASGMSGCGREPSAPASIKAWQESTDTAAAASDTASPGATSTVSGTMSPAEQAKLESRVEVLSVGYAAEGAYLIVNLTAPPRLAMLWQPGELSVVNEATNVTYNKIPLMPKIGFLIGRPAAEGQVGYVMFENKPYVKPGTKVTVRLGNVVKQHVVTQTSQATTPTAP